MKITVVRAGILEEYLPQNFTFEYYSMPFLSNLIDFLEKERGPGLRCKILTGSQLKSDVTVLINGRSIRTFDTGLDTPINDGDVIVFAVAVDGG